MGIVDSSVLIAYLNKADALHEEACKIDLTGAAINQLVFAEVANVLQKRVADRKLVRAVLREVLDNTPILSLTNDEMNEAFSLFSNAYPKLSFTDCTLAIQSKHFGLKLLTFDKELLKYV